MIRTARSVDALKKKISTGRLVNEIISNNKYWQVSNWGMNKGM